MLAGLKGGKSVELVTDRLINKGLTVRGAFGVNADAYIEAIRIIESGRFPLEKMASGTFELADTEAAIQALADGDAIHTCVCPNPLPPTLGGGPIRLGDGRRRRERRGGNRCWLTCTPT